MSREKIYVKNHYRYDAIFIFSILAMLIGLFFDSPKEILDGYIKILQSPSHLLTDYMSVGGIGATFLNAGMLMLLASFVLWRRKQLLTGPIIAALFTLFGFSLFGKNLFNTIPITFGVYLYGKIEGLKFNTLTMNSLFGTALGPAVSYICFGIGLPFFKGFLISYAVGILIGMLIPALSVSFLRFHQGYSLYNIGFTCGVIGLFIQGIFKSFYLEVKNANIVSDGNLRIAIIMYIFFFIVFALGFYLNGFSFKNLGNLLKNSGRAPSDFGNIYGRGVSMINMATLGIIYTTYVLLMNQPLNGPILGGIFTVFGFGIFGKHIKNVLPILLGTLIAYFLNIYDPHSVSATVTILFATNLAPVAGEYGIFAGMVAGFCHVSIVSSVGLLHGGLNLYNNGFSGGFVAATLVPIFEAIKNSRFFDEKGE
ncbi:DUF1576 domain-containing protein [uncultured Parvimonas sp.]|uniref:DUF1576 domain-containing protein n=1 Tax=uncultured Parvimonas sp. TaxID=747372 RepID=UPI0025999B09|nr:DUF1576 domain-containing protein [uncultured Parvimonas sp.]